MKDTKDNLKRQLNSAIYDFRSLFRKYLLIVLFIIPCTFLSIIPIMNRESSVKGANFDREIKMNEQGIFEISYLSLINFFFVDEANALSKLSGKEVHFTAYVRNVSTDILGNTFLILNPVDSPTYQGMKIQCFLDNSNHNIPVEGDNIDVRGVLDERIEHILLKNCVIEEKLE